jgi:hypothetical protein
VPIEPPATLQTGASDRSSQQQGRVHKAGHLPRSFASSFFLSPPPHSAIHHPPKSLHHFCTLYSAAQLSRVIQPLPDSAARSSRLCLPHRHAPDRRCYPSPAPATEASAFRHYYSASAVEEYFECYSKHLVSVSCRRRAAGADRAVYLTPSSIKR